jgi:hypothetical protein
MTTLAHVISNISLQRTSHDKVHVTRHLLRAAELGRYITVPVVRTFGVHDAR